MNVRARISDGRTFLVAMSQAIRRVMTWVLPVPAPATMSSGPSPWVTARDCSRFRPAEQGGDAAVGIRAAPERRVGPPLRAPDGDLAQAGRLAADPRAAHPLGGGGDP